MKWVKSRPCDGCTSRRGCDNHHIIARKPRGRGTYRDIIPLCRWCHQEWGNGGGQTFARNHGIDPRALADALEANWQKVQHRYMI